MKDKKEGKSFKAVEFMREQRDRLSNLYQNDRDAFLAELDKAKQDFLARRKKKGKHSVKQIDDGKRKMVCASFLYLDIVLTTPYYS